MSAQADISTFGDSERQTQNRVVSLFRHELGYTYLGDLQSRTTNSNIEDERLSAWLKSRGHSDAAIGQALYKLKLEANNPERTLYANNKTVYEYLRFGIDVKTAAGSLTETVSLVDWSVPENNDFSIAEEVTLKGVLTRRPDVVLYVNGIAFAVLELKNSRVSIGDGIGQSLSNQQPAFHQSFFSTIQFVLAGNDSEGLVYGTIETPAKMFLRWKEDVSDNSRLTLDKYLLRMFNKPRAIELMRDFVLFDGGFKKLPRVHQYFGIKAAQEYVRNRKSGIIWHTQGSGKSIVMVLLAKWILENNPNARVVIVTDRDELDKQIERVFLAAGEKHIKRTSSGRELMRFLGEPSPRLLCSLIHKFGKKGVDNFEAFIREIQENPSPTFGEVFVFVDEAHRTQSGKLHRVMKALMPDAVFIGFTGTPLLKVDKRTSLEVFGGYIHTYKFSEGVEDKVILDLMYEARDIDQTLDSPEKVNEWFEAKTRGLNNWRKDELKKHWATMQNVLSSASRMGRVVREVTHDFSTKPRLSSERGNAILVASSIYEACKYYELFQSTPMKKRCALITSYNPQSKDVTKEETGANSETDKQYIYNLYTEILGSVSPKPNKTKAETYEDAARELFIEEPAKMRLLIVVDKLLTGFDAPSCSYIYIDKAMQDHGLFQAITRTNRLDGDDKQYGNIVDFKNLFKKVGSAMAVYTSEVDDSEDGAPSDIVLKDRLQEGRERLDNALESLTLICEPVLPPKTELEIIHYFCGNSEIQGEIDKAQPQRVALYKGVATFIRSYAEMADELLACGYSDADIKHLAERRTHYLNMREVVRKASGEFLDLKPYEADMRHLIDTYIDADKPRVISPFNDMSLLEIIEKTNINSAIETQLGSMKGNQTAIAETIENNVRKKIIKEHLIDPAFYESMSSLLAEIIAARRAKAIEYEEYLKQIAKLVEKVQVGHSDDTPAALDTQAKRALWNNLGRNESLALQIDAVVQEARPDNWRGNQAREQIIKRALFGVLKNVGEVERVFLIVNSQEEY